MDPLKINHSVLKFVGVCAVKESTSFSIKIRNQLFYGLMVVMHIINTVLSGLYFVKFVSSDYNGAMYGFLSATVLICNLHTLITLRLHSKEMRKIFSTLKSVHRESEATKKR